MTEVLAQKLSNKAVMAADGTELGVLYNVEMDLDSGRLTDMTVEPNEQIQHRSIPFDYDDRGYIRIPMSNLRAIKDHIIVER